MLLALLSAGLSAYMMRTDVAGNVLWNGTEAYFFIYRENDGYHVKWIGYPLIAVGERLGVIQQPDDRRGTMYVIRINAVRGGTPRPGTDGLQAWQRTQHVNPYGGPNLDQLPNLGRSVLVGRRTIRAARLRKNRAGLAALNTSSIMTTTGTGAAGRRILCRLDRLP